MSASTKKITGILILCGALLALLLFIAFRALSPSATSSQTYPAVAELATPAPTPTPVVTPMPTPTPIPEPIPTPHLGSRLTPPPAPEVGAWEYITIIGDPQFTRNTQTALDIIRTIPETYDIVLRYIGIIRQGTSSGMWAWLNPPTFVVGHATYTASTTWYASTIVHDAIHSWQYHTHLAAYGHVPNEVWMGYYAEMEALEIQIQFLIDIWAPLHEIEWAEYQKNIVWWDEEPWW